MARGKVLRSSAWMPSTTSPTPEVEPAARPSAKSGGSERSEVRLIDGDLVKALPRENVTIRDTALRGFQIRVRFSGRRGLTATYRVELRRGVVRSLGRVGLTKLTAAREAARLALAGVWSGEDPAKPAAVKDRVTFGTYLDETYGPWLQAHQRHGDETLARLKATFAAWAGRRLDAIDAWDVEQWRTTRRKAKRSGERGKPDGARPKATTINRDLDDLRALFSRAIEWGHVERSPLRKVKRERIDRRGVVRFLTPDEEAALRKALEARDTTRRAKHDAFIAWRLARHFEAPAPFGTYTDHLTPLVLLALNTGLRRGELLTLTWGDVRLDETPPVLHVRGEVAKSAQSRTVPLNREAQQVLTAWRPSPVIAAALVFAGDDGAPMHDVRSAWESVLKASKVIGFRFHDLRHTFASKLVQRGVDLNVVRELLGHADLKMTLRYAHLAPKNAVDAVAKLMEGN